MEFRMPTPECRIDGCDARAWVTSNTGTLCPTHVSRLRKYLRGIVPLPIEPADDGSCGMGDGKPVQSFGVCSAHGYRLRTWFHPGESTPIADLTGNPIEADTLDADAFWATVERGDGCWTWLGSCDARGYGTWRGRRVHRIAWTLTHGPIGDGMVIDHLCANPSCCRPDHLDPTTVGENVARGGEPHFGAAS